MDLPNVDELRKLWDVIGASSEFDLKEKQLRDGEERFALIDGPPGSGKSWFATALARSISTAQGSRAFLLLGDRAMADRSFVPFAMPVSLRADVPSRKKRARAADPFEPAERPNGDWSPPKLPFLEPRETDFLRRMSEFAPRRNVIFVCDNLQWWDRDSLRFLKFLLKSGSLWQELSLFTSLCIIGVRTSAEFQPGIHQSILDFDIYPEFESKTTLTAIRGGAYRAAFHCLHLTGNFSDSELENIGEVFKGNLAWMRQVVAVLNSNEGGGVSVESGLSAIDSLVRKRITDSARTNSKLVETLKCAAILGLHFLRTDLICLVRRSQSEVSEDLNFARNQGFINFSDSEINFVHEVFQRYFAESIGEDATEIYRRLSECLQLGKPGDYDMRMIAADRAGHRRMAAAYAVMAAVKRARLGIGDAMQFVIGQDALLQRGGMTRLARDLVELWRAIIADDAYTGAEILRRLDSNIDIPPEVVRAEMDFARCQILLATREENERNEAIKRLLFWHDYQAKEAEVGARMSLALIYAYVTGGRVEEAQTVLKDLQLFAAEKENELDSDLLHATNIAKRISEAFYDPEIAEVTIEESVEYFGPGLGVAPRHPAEYVRSLNNRGACLTSVGRNSEAESLFSKASETLATFADATFRDPEVVYSNLIVARWNERGITAEKALEMQRELISRRHSESLTNVMMLMNAVNYAMASGDSASASALFDSMVRLVRPLRRPEGFFNYLVEQTRVILEHHFSGATDTRQRWARLEPIIETIAYADHAFYLRRHSLLAKAFDVVPRGDIDAFDRFPMNELPRFLGPSWYHYGRGLKSVIIQYWRIS